MDHQNAFIQHDYDRIAHFAGDGWNHNSHYHSLLLNHLSPHIESALDIGCGIGTFSRALAQRAQTVLAIDLSPTMLETAKERSRCFPNIEYRRLDAATIELPSASFDCIASVAAFHHLPLSIVLPKIKQALKPGGLLLVLDIYRPTHWTDGLLNLLSFPVHIGMRLLKIGRIIDPLSMRIPWLLHSVNDRYLTIPQVRKAFLPVFPGAQIRKRLFWRYSLIWQKPYA